MPLQNHIHHSFRGLWQWLLWLGARGPFALPKIAVPPLQCCLQVSPAGFLCACVVIPSPHRTSLQWHRFSCQSPLFAVKWCAICWFRQHLLACTCFYKVVWSYVHACDLHFNSNVRSSIALHTRAHHTMITAEQNQISFSFAEQCGTALTHLENRHCL